MGDSLVQVSKVLWLILFANLAVALVKIFIGGTTGSESLTADGYHSLADGTSNVVALIGLRIAALPIDDNHPYGHSKYETLATLVIAAMLFIMGFNIIFDAATRIVAPVAIRVDFVSLLFLALTLGVNVFVATYEYRKGQQFKSALLISDAGHTRSDIAISLGVLVTLVGIKYGLPFIIDPLASLIVAGFILYTGYEIFKPAASILTDAATIDVQKVGSIVNKFECVKNVHNIRSRGCSENLFIDMHIQIDPKMSIDDSHVLAHDIEKAFKREFSENVQVIVHLEPFYENMDKKSHKH
jgi:cation diffusion facilitator family transporter